MKVKKGFFPLNENGLTIKACNVTLKVAVKVKAVNSDESSFLIQSAGTQREQANS